MEYNVSVNGIEVSARYSDRAVRELFLPLLERLTAMQKQKGRRILAMLAAPPGAGKSTLCSFLESLSGEFSGTEEIQAVGMDGFHRRQEYLLSHTICRDGEEIPLVKIKGAPVTFDLDRLTEHVKRAAAGENCSWPVYDRILHNPVEDAIRIHKEIILLEGNYLLLNEDGWRELSTFADYTISIRAEEGFLRTRLVDRRVKTGVEREAAVQFVDYSDMQNVRLCLEKTMPADLQLELDSDGEWEDLTENSRRYG